MNNNLRSRQFKALLATQFLGAFNDNAFRLIISLVAVEHILKSAAGTEYLSGATAFFVLPFLLFSSYAGYFADRFSKRTIIIHSKFAELAIMTLGMIALLSGNFAFIYAMLFLMGLQSTFFSPAKYGILPEVLTSKEISEGNGLLQMWTYLAIILGTGSGGLLIAAVKGKAYLASVPLIIISLLGIITGFHVHRVPPSGSERTFRPNFLGDIWFTLRIIRKNRALYLSMIGISYFAFLAALFQLNLFLYTSKMMHGSHLSTGLFLTMVALGVGAGSLLAGKLSGGKIEFGFVPLGSAGLSIFSILLAFSYRSIPFTSICLIFLGIFSGFFIVPLNAYIQQHSPKTSKGRFLATTNFLSFLGILTASGVLWLLLEGIGLSSTGTFAFLGALTIIGTIYIIWLLPYSFIRLIVWLLTHSLYKVKAVGTDNIPKHGGALLISNHVSFVDPLLIGTSIERQVRFIMLREIYQNPFLNWFFRLMKAILISPKDPPKKMLDSLQAARDAIASGELVCIFPEGHLTLTGHVRRFTRGLSGIIKGINVPVIPIYLDRIWGSIFSFENRKFFFKMPKRIPHPVTVMFGKEIPSSSNAFELSQAVRELGAEAFSYRIPEELPLHMAFWREAKKSFMRFCMTDFTGKKFSYGKALVSSIALGQVIKSKCSKNENVGVMLPPSCAGALVNIALSMLGRTVVNLNYTCSDQILDSVISQCKIKDVITSRKFLEKLELKNREEMIFAEDLKNDMKFKYKIKGFLLGFFLPARIAEKLLTDGNTVSMSSLSTIIFSSGSTGVPKGIMLSHHNITSNIESLRQVFYVDSNDRILGILPLFHSFGYTATLWFPLVSGMGVIYHSNPKDASQIGKLVRKNNATILISTPTFLRLYMKRCTPEQFKSLRIVIVGAEKLTEELALAFKNRLGALPMEGYGTTELSPIVSVNLPDKKEAGKQITHKPGTIGLPLPGIAAKVVNPDTMQDLPVDHEGLLLVKGQNVMVGYLDKPDKTKGVVKDGWYTTGDIASIDSDGFIKITDRLSRFSKVGGEMVPHIKIEEEIHSILKTEERKCVVAGIKDEKKGERLVVLYAGEMDVCEVWDRLSKSSLPKLWIPRKEDFYQIDEIPILGTGKVDLMSVKKLAEEKAGK